MTGFGPVAEWQILSGRDALADVWNSMAPVRQNKDRSRPKPTGERPRFPDWRRGYSAVFDANCGILGSFRIAETGRRAFVAENLVAFSARSAQHDITFAAESSLFT